MSPCGGPPAREPRRAATLRRLLGDEMTLVPPATAFPRRVASTVTLGTHPARRPGASTSWTRRRGARRAPVERSRLARRAGAQAPGGRRAPARRPNPDLDAAPATAQAQRRRIPAVAERSGFEPEVGFDPHTALAMRRFRPLSHLSAGDRGGTLARPGGGRHDRRRAPSAASIRHGRGHGAATRPRRRGSTRNRRRTGARPDGPRRAMLVVMARKTPEKERAEEPVLCSVFDQTRGRPCGEPAEPDSLTCRVHRVRPTRTQLSRIDAARKRYG